MDELPAEARAFLEAQRDAHDPPAGMSERVWRAAGLGEAAALTGLAPRLRLEPTWWKGGSASLAAKAAGGALNRRQSRAGWLVVVAGRGAARAACCIHARRASAEYGRGGAQTGAAGRARTDARPRPADVTGGAAACAVGAQAEAARYGRRFAR